MADDSEAIRNDSNEPLYHLPNQPFNIKEDLRFSYPASPDPNDQHVCNQPPQISTQNIKQEEVENKVDLEEESEVQKLSEELMAYENYIKFYQLPYMEGQVAAAPACQEAAGATYELWSFDDLSFNDVPSAVDGPKPKCALCGALIVRL